MSYLRTFPIALAVTALGLVGCGGGGDGGFRPPPRATAQIVSDPTYDGDIQQTSSTTFAVTQGMTATIQSVFTGIDPATLTEYRAFLDFPLAGPAGVPGNAMIEQASLDIFVNSIQPTAGSLPLLIELVAFQPPNLLATDFDRTIQPPLAFIRVSPPFVQSDVGTNVSIDVTPLMIEAQNRGLTDFQVRILEDLGASVPVLLEINDSTGSDRAIHAPVLTVTYF